MGEVPTKTDWFEDIHGQPRVTGVICIGTRLRMLYGLVLLKAGISVRPLGVRPIQMPDSIPPFAVPDPPGTGCPSRNNIEGELYSTNNLYDPPDRLFTYMNPGQESKRVATPAYGWVE